jgi:hypothetical protein
MYTHIAKFCAEEGAGASIQRKILKGHCFAIPHDGPLQTVALMSADAVVAHVRLALVGPNGEADRLLRGVLASSFLSCDPRPALLYLRALAALHPAFAEVDVDALDTPQMRSDVTGIQERLFTGALRATDPLDLRIETQARADIAGVRWQTAPETLHLPRDNATDEEFVLTVDGILLSSHEGAQIVAPRPHAADRTPTPSADPVDSQLSSEDRTNALLIRGIAEAFGSQGGPTRTGSEPSVNAETEESMPTVTLQREGQPLNEFSEPARISYTAFPHLFPLGAGLPDNPITAADDEHLLSQDSLAWAHSDEYIFYRFNTVCV